jgi:hypothetical protein
LLKLARQSDSDPYDTQFRQTFDQIFQLLHKFYRIFRPIRPLQTRVFLSNHWVKLGKLEFSRHQELPINHIIRKKNQKISIFYTWRVDNSNPTNGRLNWREQGRPKQRLPFPPYPVSHFYLIVRETQVGTL